MFADFRLVEFVKTNSLWEFAQGLTGYLGIAMLLTQTLRYKNLLYTKSLWDGVSGIVEAAAAYFFLGNRLDSTQEYVGLGFTLVGVLLLQTA